MKSDVILCNDGRFPIIFLRDHCLQNCHLGRQIVHLVDINFVLRRWENAICDHKTNDFPFITITFNTTAPILNNFCSHFSLKLYNFAIKTIDASNVKPDVSQWKATLRNSVGFLTVYRRSVSIVHITEVKVRLSEGCRPTSAPRYANADSGKLVNWTMSAYGWLESHCTIYTTSDLRSDECCHLPTDDLTCLAEQRWVG